MCCKGAKSETLTSIACSKDVMLKLVDVLLPVEDLGQSMLRKHRHRCWMPDLLHLQTSAKTASPNSWLTTVFAGWYNRITAHERVSTGAMQAANDFKCKCPKKNVSIVLEAAELSRAYNVLFRRKGGKRHVIMYAPQTARSELMHTYTAMTWGSAKHSDGANLGNSHGRISGITLPVHS